MAAEFRTHLLEQVLQEGTRGPLALAELRRELSLWSSSSLAAQPVPSLPLQGVVLEDRGAPWLSLRGFFVREAPQFQLLQSLETLEPP